MLRVWEGVVSREIDDLLFELAEKVQDMARKHDIRTSVKAKVEVEFLGEAFPYGISVEGEEA